MLERPDAQDLLATARDSLLHKLLPALPAPLHYEARMAANAIAIAARALATPGAEAEAALRGFLPDEADPLACLARRIRAGEFAPGSPRHAEARALLEALTRARCAVSNPKALA
jgi:hypothetical protein